MTALTTLRRNFRRIIDAYQAALDAVGPCDYSAALRQWNKLRRELLPPPDGTDATLVDRLAAPPKRETHREDWPVVDAAAEILVRLLWVTPVPCWPVGDYSVSESRLQVVTLFQQAVHTLSRIEKLLLLSTAAAAPTTPPTGTQQSEGRDPGATTDSMMPALLSAADLAKHINEYIKRNPKSVTSFLSRFAEKYPDCRVETPTKRKNEPGYLYRTAAVWPALQKWAKGMTEN